VGISCGKGKIIVLEFTGYLIPSPITRAQVWVERSHVARLRLELVLEDNVQGVDDTGDVSQDCQKNVDEEISSASSFKEDTQRGDKDCTNDLDNIAASGRHF